MVMYQNRLRVPIPGYGSPYESQRALNEMERRDRMGIPSLYDAGAVTVPGAPGAPPPSTQIPMPSSGVPSMPEQRMPPLGGGAGVPGAYQQENVRPMVTVQRPPAEPPKPPEVSDFFKTVWKSMENVDPEQRAEYLQGTMANIQERLGKYEFRLARGIPLTPEQQRQYDSLKAAFNDLQKYINDPKTYDDFLSGKWQDERRRESLAAMYAQRSPVWRYDPAQ